MQLSFYNFAYRYIFPKSFVHYNLKDPTIDNKYFKNEDFVCKVDER